MFEWISNKVVEFLAPRAVKAVAENIPTVVQVGATAYKVGTAAKKAVDTAGVIVDKTRKVAGDVVASVAGGTPFGAVKEIQEAAEAKARQLLIEEIKAEAAKYAPIVIVIVVYLVVRARRKA